jgi:membrane-bound serine protease (ClpP class)
MMGRSAIHTTAPAWLRHRVGLVALAVLAWTFANPAAAADGATPSKVWVLELDGAIGPATADYFMTSLEDAQDADVALFVIQLDTPGGLDKSMRDMIKEILASHIPVVTYVAPNGSRAASAGTYILYASHVAAMAPATNVGSSTPVSIGGPTPFPTAPVPKPDDKGDDKDDESDDDAGGGAAKPGTAMERKVINDAVAYIRGLAELRGRNVEWAEQTVRDASNLPASEALEQNVIDLIAEDLDDLLAQLDGRELQIDHDTKVTLDLTDAEVTRLEPGWRYELLAIITDPNVAYILLMIGVYGLILEFYNPGMGAPGVVGVICLLLGAYALQMLPINYAGLALIIAGIAMMVGEAFTPTLGVVGLGGVVAFIIGSIILMDTDLPAYQISLPIIAALAAASAGLFVFVVGAAFKARTGRVRTGTEGMIGGLAEVLDDFDGLGRVRAFGEIWQARADVPLSRGTSVRVSRVDGLVLSVEPNKDEGV